MRRLVSFVGENKKKIELKWNWRVCSSVALICILWRHITNPFRWTKLQCCFGGRRGSRGHRANSFLSSIPFQFSFISHFISVACYTFTGVQGSDDDALRQCTYSVCTHTHRHTAAKEAKERKDDDATIMYFLALNFRRLASCRLHGCEIETDRTWSE